MQRRAVTTEPLNASTPLPALAEDVTPIGTHYVRNHFPVPDVEDPDDWVLRIDGHVGVPSEFTVSELRDLPSKTLAVTLECAGNGRTRMTPLPKGTPWDDGAVGTARWTGVPLRDVLERAGLRDGALEVAFRGADHGEAGGRDRHFERSLPLADALHPDTLLAYEMNGQPLPPEHGHPLRAIVPGWYAMASVKWLSTLTVLARPFEGYYQTEDYLLVPWNGGSRPTRPVTRMRLRALLATPSEGDTLPAGREHLLQGRAWSGEHPVASVHVTTDGGKTWTEAKLDAPVGPHAWRRFTLAWTPQTPGEHVLLARATATDGTQQPLEPASNEKGYENNSALPVRIQVR